MNRDFDWTLFIDSLWERENAKGKRGMEGKGGFKKGKYYPYTTPNGNKDIGPGLDLDKQTPEFVARAQKGFTKAELDSIVKARLKDERNHFNERIVKEGGNPEKLNDNVLAGLYDMYWQIKNGLYQEYPKFWKGVAANDYKKMQDESATYYTPANGKIPKDAIVKNGKVLDKGRWDYRKDTYFKEPQNTPQKSPTIHYDSEFLENWDEYKKYLPKGTPPPVIGDKVPVMAEGGQLNRRKKWNDLSMKERSDMMNAAIRNGITDLHEIKKRYNEFAEGGPEEEQYTGPMYKRGYTESGTPYYTGSYSPELGAYVDPTWYDETGEYNIGLPEVTVKPSGEGYVNAAQEKAAPVIRNILLGSAALAGGIPALANAAVGTTTALAPGSAFWTNPLTQQMAAGMLAGTTADAASTAVTGRPVGKVMSDVINRQTGWNPADNVFSQAAVDMLNPFYYTPYGVASKGINTAVNVAKIASPKYRSLHAYNAVNPVGYDHIMKRGKDWLIDMVQDNYVDLKNPKFYRDLVAQANGVRPEFGYTETGSYMGKGIKNAGQIADEARLDAWAIHNRLEPQYGTYIKNPDGSYSYDMANIMKKSEGTWYPKSVPKKEQHGNGLDFVTGAGGGLTDFRLIGEGDYGNGLMHIEDLWDINPYSRRGDGLSNRMFPNWDQKFGNKLWTKALNLEVYGTEHPETTAGKLARKAAEKLYKASEKPLLGLLSPIDNAMKKFEIGMITGGKPFLMKTDIPFHKSPTFAADFSKWIIDPASRQADTVLHPYNYGYNPDYVANVKRIDKLNNFNIKNIDWNKLKLTEP